MRTGLRVRQDDEVMTVAEVAAYLHISPSTIYRLLQKGLLPAFHIGSDWRFRADAIEAWVEEGRGAYSLPEIPDGDHPAVADK